MVQADCFSNLAQRQPLLLRLRECLSPGVTRGPAITLKLLLGRFHCLAGHTPLYVVGHSARTLASQ